MTTHQAPMISVFFPISAETNPELLNLSLFSLSGQSFDSFKIIFISEKNRTLQFEPLDLLSDYPFRPFALSESKHLKIPLFDPCFVSEVFKEVIGGHCLWLAENSLLYMHALDSLYSAWLNQKKALTLCGLKKTLLSRDPKTETFHSVSKKLIYQKEHSLLSRVTNALPSPSCILIDQNQTSNFKWVDFSPHLSFSYQLSLNLIGQFEQDLSLIHTPLCESLFLSNSEFEKTISSPTSSESVKIELRELHGLVLENEQMKGTLSRRAIKWAMKLDECLKRNPRLRLLIRNTYSVLHSFLSCSISRITENSFFNKLFS